MSKNTKRILTGHVARLIDGELVTAGPGDVAPNWVTNPDLIAAAEQSAATTPVTTTPTTSETTGDDLDSLGIEALRELAGQAGVAKNGRKAEIADRIRAKRAAEAAGAGDTDDDGDTGDDGDTDEGREALVARATELGIENAEDLTDDELQAVIEQGE